MAVKRYVFLASIFLAAGVLGIYHVYFKRPPNSELMKMNARKKTSGRTGTEHDVEQVTGGKGSRSKDQGSDVWKEFVERNKFVSIGDVWDRDCDDKARQTVGTVTLIPDEEHGGMKTRTYINYTLSEEVTEGEFYIDVKYNKKDLYDNHWDLCSFEDDLDEDERSIFCPIRKGKNTDIKDKEIPVYLPKGDYFTKSWVVDQNGKTVMCGTSDLIL